MTKSSDEIKKAMLHCSPVSCRSDGCPYRDDTPKYEGDMPVCRMKLWHDMVCLIQQLEAERDAAVDGLKSNCTCPECKYFSDDIQDPCRGCKPNASKFEWRGVPKEPEA